MNDKPLSPLIQTLADAIEAKGLKITFGIQPSHLEVIERHLKKYDAIEIEDMHPGAMLYSEHFWQDVGKEIGWLPFTIALHYFRWKSRQE